MNLYVQTKEQNTTDTYLHKTMLTRVYSVDQKWEGTSANTCNVAADIVSMDSKLPVKKRESLSTSSGKLPKVGMSMNKNESDINALNLMKAQMNMMKSEKNEAGAKSQLDRIYQRFANDGWRCSKGIDEKNEMNFLYGLYDGVMLTPDETNTGVGVRYNYGYDKFPANHFGVEDKDHFGRDDIERIISAANARGLSFVTIAISLAAYNMMRKERWARELVASADGQTYVPETSLPVPSPKKFDEAFASEFGGITFLKIDRTIYVEKNGVQTPIKPFGNDKMVFLTSEMVGSLVWGTLAEVTNPVDGVEYQIVDEYKLIAEFSDTNPLVECTTGQALVVPVIENVDKIYTLDKKKAYEVDETAEKEDSSDIYITIGEKKYSKPAVIEALKTLGISIRANSKDETVIAHINSLDDEKKQEFINSLSPIE